TAFLSLVFGYLFYWTAKDDFLPADASLGVWPIVGLIAVGASWALTLLGRRLNRAGRGGAFYGALALGVGLAIAGAVALLAGPYVEGMDPTRHVYPAMVWLLLGWTALHVALGVVMQLYCVA